MEHARSSAEAASVSTFDTEDSSHSVEGDICNPDFFKELFADLTFRPEEYTRYQGLDHTALFASSVTLTNKYAVIGSNGYDTFKGIVHVYVPKTTTKWSLQALIRSPVWDNNNFGNDVSVDDEQMVVAANAYQQYDGIVFVYKQNPIHQCWLLVATITSPLAIKDTPERKVFQGFGYRVDISGQFLIVGTAINNAYIYKEVSPDNWVLHADLVPPAEDIFFGRSVSIEGDLAMVGAYGQGRSNGCVYLYKYDNATDTWGDFGSLPAPRNNSAFGYSVDMHGTNIVVGANGFVANQFENRKEFDARNTQQIQNSGWAYVYYLNENKTEYVLDAEIDSPVGNNSYFGVSVGIYENSVIVGADGFPCHGLTGAGFVFYRNPYSGQWTLNQSYPSPAGYQGHFGYAVDIAQNYSVIGAYGFDDLRGSVYLADRAPEEVPVPTMAPSFAATAAPSNPAEVLSGGGLNRRVNKSELTLGMVLALALGVLIIAAATGLICYCCCCMVPIIPLLKKKKKKEEENSPYTVHSYAGYIEEDEYIAPILLVEDEKLKEKEKEKSVKFMEDGTIRKMFPYKVYGPRGYSEGNNETVPDELLERKKEENLSNPETADDSIYLQEDQFEYDNDMNRKIAGEAETREVSNIHAIHVEHARRNLQSYREQQSHQGSYSTLTDTHGASNSSVVSSHRSSLSSMHDDEDDEDTVLSGATELSSSTRSSLVEQAKLKYKSFVQSKEVITSTTTTSNYVSAAKAKYASMSHSRSRDTNDDNSQQTGSSGTPDSGLSYVEAAKSRYANLKRDVNLSSKSGDSSELSMVERTKQRYAMMKSSDSMKSGDGEVTPAIRVLAAKEKYEILQNTTSHTSSSYKATHTTTVTHDENVDSGDEEQTALSRSTTSSTPSAVELARAKYAKLRRNREEALGTNSATNSLAGTATVSAASTEMSLVDDIKARYAQSKSADDASSVVSASTQSTGMSLVEAAKAKYANLKKNKESASTEESDVSSAVSSVDAAKKNFQHWKEQQNHTATATTTTSSSKMQQSSSTFTSSQQSSSQTFSQKSEIMAEQQTLSAKQSASNNGNHAAGYSTSASSVVTAADPDVTSVSSDSSSRVDSTRRAAMAKFALYKAKAEAEALKRRSSEEDSLVHTMLKERKALVAPKPTVVEEDRSIEEAVEAARLRTERLEIDARAAATANVESDESAEAARQAEREAAKLRAQAKAKENFARLKARTEASANMSAKNISADSPSDEALRKATEEARARMARSANVLAEEVPYTEPTMVMPEVNVTRTATVTSSKVHQSAVTRSVQATSSFSREVSSAKTSATSGDVKESEAVQVPGEDVV